MDTPLTYDGNYDGPFPTPSRSLPVMVTPLTYDGPGFPTPSWPKRRDNDGDGAESDDDVQQHVTDFVFRNDLPPLAELLGEYELIFFLHRGGFSHGLPTQHRVIYGKMELSSESGSNLLKAILKIPKAVKKDLTIFGGFYDDKDIRFSFNLEGGEGKILDSIDDHFDYASGTLRCVSERLAVKYMPEYCQWDRVPQPLYRAYAKSITFQSLEEAGQLLTDYRKQNHQITPLLWLRNHCHLPSEVVTLVSSYMGRSETIDYHRPSYQKMPSWIGNHLHLPSGVAKLVWDYIQRPLPLFFFEVGDLVMEFDFHDDYDDVRPKFVARRRGPLKSSNLKKRKHNMLT